MKYRVFISPQARLDIDRNAERTPIGKGAVQPYLRDFSSVVRSEPSDEQHFSSGTVSPTDYRGWNE